MSIYRRSKKNQYYCVEKPDKYQLFAVAVYRQSVTFDFENVKDIISVQNGFIDSADDFYLLAARPGRR